MKKLIFSLFFLVIVAGCATGPDVKNYNLPIPQYARELPKFPLKLSVYYQPNVEGNQLLEQEYTKYGDKPTFFTVAYGQNTFVKFNPVLNKMFEKAERTFVADRQTRFLEAKSKNLDLCCEIKVAKNSFVWELTEGMGKALAKAVVPVVNLFSKYKYSAKTDMEIRVSFYRQDGLLVIENAYPYSISDVLYINPNAQNFVEVAVKKAHEQFCSGLDEIISRMTDDLNKSEKFKEIIDSRKKPLS